MKVLLANISREQGYMVIEAFYAALTAMNVPVIAHRDDMIKFMDVDEGFQIVTLKYDIRTRSILMISST